MKTHIALLATAILLSNCTYHTYVAPPKTTTVTRRPSTSSSKYGGSVSGSTNPDSFQAVTKPSTYSH